NVKIAFEDADLSSRVELIPSKIKSSTYKEHAVEPTIEPATKHVNERVGTTEDLGGVPKEILLLFMMGVLRPALGRGSTKQREDDTRVLSIFDDDEGLNDCLELKDATACHLKISAITPSAWKDNIVNKRSHELLVVIEKLKEKMYSLATEAKEHKGNLDRLMLKSQKWLGYQVSLLDLESKVASLEAKKANLEATKALLHQEIEEVKHDRREVVSKVLPYACMELLHSDELGRLVGKLVSSAITFDRNRAYDQFARMKEPFDLSKVKGYRSSYEKDHTQASNDLATAIFSWLNEYVADDSAYVEALLLKKPPTL
nr:hypothetical protein [Tanacetum cinerariifolium]